MSAAEIPFSPRIADVPGDCPEYSDGRVTAAVGISEDGSVLSIYEWNSADPGRGHSVEALAWLRERFTEIRAIDVGSVDEEPEGLVPDISVLYWDAMMAKGLVDRAFLDDGTERTRETASPGPG